MQKNNIRLKNNILLFVMLFVCIISLVGGIGGTAYAALSDYSNVKDDLLKDENFNAWDYPQDDKDYSIKVIQIAESVNGNLYLYTYQPCQSTLPLVATEINMSLSETADGTKLYTLTPINSSGVFCKYLVDGVKVGSDVKRYYNITSIFRDWLAGIDNETGNDNEIKSKYFTVGKLFTAETTSNGVKYSCKNVDVIEIINPYVDFISYGESSGWDLIFDVVNWTDIHYIAFSTDKRIDTLKEADVTYTTQSYHFTGKNDEGYTYGEKTEPQYITLTGKEEVGVDGYEKYTWKSIYRTEDFIKTTELTGSAKKEVEKSEFVLVFLKTSFKEQEQWSPMQGHYKVADGTKVSDVAILRLMFETDGITYNLSALMDKQEGDDIAGNKPESERIGFWAYIWRCIVRLFNGTATLTEQIVAVVAIFICVMFLPILLTVLSLVFPAFGAVMKTLLKDLWAGIKYLFIGLWYVVSAPFRFIAWLIRKAKGEN